MNIFSDDHQEEAIAWVFPVFFQPAQPLDDPSTPWDEFTVYSWIALYPGTVHGTCEGVTFRLPGPVHAPGLGGGVGARGRRAGRPR